MTSEPSVGTTKPKFYMLEYFYVLLKSVEKYSDKEQVFDAFKVLKQEHRLGESKYKTLVADPENLSKARVDKYKYTFEGVIEEAKDYGLIDVVSINLLTLTAIGQKLLLEFESESRIKFNQSLMVLMESKYNNFKYAIEFLYQTNRHKPGLLIFPIYSPRILGFDKPMIKKTSDLIRYSERLVDKLEEDIRLHLHIQRNLIEENKLLLSKLNTDGLLSSEPSDNFDLTKYNVVVKRFRDFWIKYFLEKIYDCKWSWSTFERWVYRGKQIGIIHATEFYPNFNGKIVYPTSIIVKVTHSADFEELHRYIDGDGLYIHSPEWDTNEGKFVSSLVNAYFDLRRFNRSYFISLSSLRELVCYKMKISEFTFDKLLDHAYKLNLAGRLAVRISLEVDKHPDETRAMYLTKEPVMIDGKYRNIIAIDVTKGDRFNEQVIEKTSSGY